MQGIRVLHMNPIRSKSIQDPFGNTILVSSEILSDKGCKTFEEVEEIITNPAFTIEVKDTRRIYFFRSLDWDINLMMETRSKTGHFAVEAWCLNPTAEFISSLLKQGTLSSFK